MVEGHLHVQVASCNGQVNQQFLFKDGVIHPNGASTVSSESAWCLDGGDKMVAGAEPIFSECNGSPSQQFGYDAKMKTIYSAAGQTDATMCVEFSAFKVQLWGCNGLLKQEWAVGPPPPPSPSTTPAPSPLPAMISPGIVVLLSVLACVTCVVLSFAVGSTLKGRRRKVDLGGHDAGLVDIEAGAAAVEAREVAFSFRGTEVGAGAAAVGTGKAAVVAVDISAGVGVPAAVSSDIPKEAGLQSSASDSSMSASDVGANAIYEIETNDIGFGGMLGRGGFATVYLAYWQGSKTAAKCFDLRGLGQKQRDTLKRSFRREIEVSFELRSPRILSVLGICTSVPEHLYIIMELAEGGSVRTMLDAATAPLEPSVLWGLAQDTALGMKYLHGRNIVHRDLKSPNVLLDAHGGAKVSDFGTARSTSNFQDYTCAGNTASGNIVGSVAWMSPEALEGKSSFQSDVFSFGVYLWEMATLDTPWKGMGVAPIVCAVCFKQERLSTDSIVSEGCYTALPELLGRCWRQCPDERPSFDELESEVTAEYARDVQARVATFTASMT